MLKLMRFVCEWFGDAFAAFLADATIYWSFSLRTKQGLSGQNDFAFVYLLFRGQEVHDNPYLGII